MDNRSRRVPTPPLPRPPGQARVRAMVRSPGRRRPSAGALPGGRPSHRAPFSLQPARRCHALQTDVKRIGGKLRSSACTIRFGSHGHRLRLVAAQCKRHRELAAGLDRELARRATALTQGRFRFCPWRFGFNGQSLRLRSGFEEIQARHGRRTRRQHQATRHQDNNSAHDPTPRRQRPPLPGTRP